MIIRATSKLLNISGIKPVKFENNSDEVFPGEWYAKTVRTGQMGRLAILFLHSQTKISIICQTKSLKLAIKQLPGKLRDYLVRHKFETLIDSFDINSDAQVFTTNSKTTLGFMNQLSMNIEWNMGMAESQERIDCGEIEDILSKYLFSIDGKAGKYETTIDILNRITTPTSR